MGKEIERKFLVNKDLWRPKSKGYLYRQGYLSEVKERVVRVRVAGDKGFFTVKGLTDGFSRLEFEYEIPIEDAHQMLDTLCETPLIEKTRYNEEYEGMLWEIDVFLIGEAWRKRRYKAAFIAKLSDAESEACETQVWIEFAKRCKYLADPICDEMDKEYDQIIGQIVRMIN